MGTIMYTAAIWSDLFLGTYFYKMCIFNIHHIYINCWLPVYRWSVMDKQVTSTPQYLEMGGGGVLVICIYITDHL